MATGKLFATEHFNIEPDILCLAKAITGGYAPMGATMMTASVGRSMERDGSFYSTYGWHPRSVAAAIASLRYLKANKRRLFADDLFAGFYRRIRAAFPGQRVRLIPSRGGFLKRYLHVDGHLVALKRARIAQLTPAQ